MDVTDTAWRSAIASGSVSAMEPERFRSIANIYSTFDTIKEALATDRDAAHTLQALSYRVALTPELRGSLIKAFYTARENRSYLAGAVSPHALAEEMSAMGWNDKRHLDALIREFKAGMVGYGVALKPCAKPFANPFGVQARGSQPTH